jgi:hypothetical protein
MDQYYLAAHADLALERWNAGEKVEAVDDLLGLPGAAAVTVSAMLMGYLHRDAPAMHELVALLVARCADLPEPAPDPNSPGEVWGRLCRQVGADRAMDIMIDVNSPAQPGDSVQ